MKQKKQEAVVEAVLRQCRTLYAELEDEYLKAGAPYGVNDHAPTRWAIETERATVKVEKRRRK